MLVPWRVSFRDVLTLSLSDQVVVSSIFHFYPWGNDPNWTIIFFKLLGSTPNLVSLTKWRSSISFSQEPWGDFRPGSVRRNDGAYELQVRFQTWPQLKKTYPTNRIHGTNGIFLPTFWLIFVVNVGESTLHGSYGYGWLGVSYGGLHPWKLTWIPTKMMVWKMQLVSNIAIFGVYVHFWGVCWCLVYEPIYWMVVSYFWYWPYRNNPSIINSV